MLQPTQSVACPTCHGSGRIRSKTRGRKPAALDFHNIDLTQPLHIIARQLKTSPARVREHWPPGVPIPEDRRKLLRRREWETVDWDKEKPADVARRLGVTRQRASYERQQYLKKYQ